MAVIYVDLRIDLLNNTVPSVRLLGEVLNRQQRAEQFIEFYQQHMAVIRQRLAGYQGPKPKVMLHLHLGRRDTCCTTAAHGNLGDLLTFAGGDNIANASVRGVRRAEPGNHPERQPRRLPRHRHGRAAGQAAVRSAPRAAGQPTGRRRQLPPADRHTADAGQPAGGEASPRLERLAQLYLSPYHVVLVEMFAKAFYPDLFADINPQQTFQQLYQQFLPLPFQGPIGVS